METLKINEVAKMLRVSKQTIYRWLKKKKIKGFKIGQDWRISKDSLMEIIRERSN